VPDQSRSEPIDIAGYFGAAPTRLMRLLAVRQYDAAGARQDPAARQRAFVPASVTRVGSEQEALDAIFAPSFVPTTDVVVEGEAPPGSSGDVSFVRDDPQRVELRADLERDGMVVLTDQLDKGWNVEVDGRDAEALRVDSVLRGVSVPAGTHTVSWTYTTPGLRAGLVLSLLGLLLIAALALLRQPRADTSPRSDRTVDLEPATERVDPVG
jgi:hypothetical protein